MKLYHGSNVEIEHIDISLCKPYKDFGQGFYLTEIYQQAELMAKRQVRILDNGKPIVSTFLFDENILQNNHLNIKIFSQPSEEWALFILENRNKKRNLSENFDIVVGPVANDGVVFQLERYLQGIISIEKLVQELTFKNLNNQYFFGTENAIKLLQKI